MRLASLGTDPDEGVQEGVGACNVARWAKRLDEADLDQRGIQLGFADLPRDALGQLHQGPALSLLLPPTRRPVLSQAATQIARLADVEEHVLRAVEAIDAGLGGHGGQEVVAELPVEGPHAPLSVPGPRSPQGFVGRSAYDRQPWESSTAKSRSSVAAPADRARRRR